MDAPSTSSPSCCSGVCACLYTHARTKAHTHTHTHTHALGLDCNAASCMHTFCACIRICTFIHSPDTCTDAPTGLVLFLLSCLSFADAHVHSSIRLMHVYPPPRLRHRTHALQRKHTCAHRSFLLHSAWIAVLLVVSVAYGAVDYRKVHARTIVRTHTHTQTLTQRKNDNMIMTIKMTINNHEPSKQLLLSTNPPNDLGSRKMNTNAQTWSRALERNLRKAIEDADKTQ